MLVHPSCFSTNSDVDGRVLIMTQNVATVTQDLRVAGFYGLSRKFLSEVKVRWLQLAMQHAAISNLTSFAVNYPSQH